MSSKQASTALVRIPRCVNLTTQRWPLTRRPKIHHHLPMLTVRRSIPCQKRRQKTSPETMVYTCLMYTAHSSALSLSAGDIVPINTLRRIADIKSRSSHSHTLTSPLRLTREGGKYPPPSIGPSRHAPILHFNLQVLIQSLLTYSSQTLHPTLRLCLYTTLRKVKLIRCWTLDLNFNPRLRLRPRPRFLP